MYVFIHWVIAAIASLRRLSSRKSLHLKFQDSSTCIKGFGLLGVAIWLLVYHILFLESSFSNKVIIKLAQTAIFSHASVTE